ncbi:serine/threonine-protein kinase [Streptomyces sp. NPDC056943]|uniref:serine/threonine-protein kinase n=1 Tax=Streptomyces sp. NPDC056943 TaxID=3345971 RepID=UPI00363DD632
MPGEQDELVGGRYRFVRAIGKGGMGKVWLARDEKLGRDVALKRVVFVDDGETSRDKQRRRFIHEAQALAKLGHSGIVGVHDVLDDLEPPVMVMEYVAGSSLQQLLRDQGSLSVRETAKIGLEILDALTEVHGKGIVHRDLKPANIVVSGTRVVVVDFGIALLQGATQLTTAGSGPASWSYTAPERLRGHRGDAASDLWSLGVTLYELVEGRRPFRGEIDAAVIHAIYTEDPWPTERAGALAPVLTGLLTREPEARLTAEALREALTELARHERPRSASHQAPAPAPTAATLAALPTVTAAPAARDAVPPKPRERTVPDVPAQAAPGIGDEVPALAARALNAYALGGLPVARLTPALTDRWEAGEKKDVQAVLKRVGRARPPAELLDLAHALRSGSYPFLADNLMRYAGRLQRPASLAKLITLLRYAERDRDAAEALAAAGKGRRLTDLEDIEEALRARTGHVQGRAATWIDIDVTLMRDAAAERPRSGARNSLPPPRNRHARAAQPFAPFWFAVPEERQLVPEDLTPRVLTRLTPGTWYLAVGWYEGGTATALIAQTQDGTRGLVWNTEGIQRG